MNKHSKLDALYVNMKIRHDILCTRQQINSQQCNRKKINASSESPDCELKRKRPRNQTSRKLIQSRAGVAKIKAALTTGGPQMRSSTSLLAVQLVAIRHGYDLFRGCRLARGPRIIIIAWLAGRLVYPEAALPRILRSTGGFWNFGGDTGGPFTPSSPSEEGWDRGYRGGFVCGFCAAVGRWLRIFFQNFGGTVIWRLL